jgi:lipoprotein NlpD
MGRWLPRTWLAPALLLLAACSGAVRWEEPAPGPPPVARAGAPPAGAEHVVKPGETLYGIASRYGLGVEQLSRWNGLGDGSLIRVGQRLRLAPPAASPVAPMPEGPGEPGEAPPRWQRPVAGPVLAAFGESPLTASGIQFGGRPGEPVRAAASGTVVYAGSGLKGYGELLIIKHGPTWLSAYGYNQALLVGEGETVTTGQAVARMGEGPGVDGQRRPALHFEIRRNGMPVDPAAQLPSAPR